MSPWNLRGQTYFTWVIFLKYFKVFLFSRLVDFDEYVDKLALVVKL
jgi:hypothetical protein